MGLLDKNMSMKMTPRKMKNKRKSVAMDKEYQIKRQRNNDAVRKSREKAKLQAEQTALRVKKLRQENESLEERLKLLSKELAFLKDIFKTHTGSNNMTFAKPVVVTKKSQPLVFNDEDNVPTIVFDLNV